MAALARTLSDASLKGHRKTPSYTDMMEENDGRISTPYESLRRRALGPVVLFAIRFALVFTLCEDGWRMFFNAPQQAAFMTAFAKSSPHRGLYTDIARRFLVCAGAAQMVAGVGVVGTRNPALPAAFMASLVALNALLWSSLVDRRGHIHGLAAYLCRMCGSFGGLLALVAHASAVERERTSQLERSDDRGRRWTGRLHLCARIFLAPYFPCSGLLHAAGAASKVAGFAGAGALLAGSKFSAVTSCLGVLLVAHGYGAYASLFAGHSKHRDALFFTFAQDLSVLASLALLAVVGPGDLSLDSLRAKRA